MFPHSNVAITGGHFFYNEVRTETAFEKLQKASAPSALYDSDARFDAPKCHPNTRVVVLEYLMGWIFGRNNPEALILWLYGPAGAGKSAILQTIAERCLERKVLLASFFFGRSDRTRNTSKPLIPTIAYQIATTVPEIRPHIESAINHDPLIFDKSIATQLQLLVIDPVSKLPSGFFDNLEACARLVLIDGLDECENPRLQSMILAVLANALRGQKTPLIFLIASRPEQNIRVTFNSDLLSGLWRSLVLDDSYKPNDDIYLFVVDSFQEIKTTHPHRKLIPETWPAQSDVNKLVNNSSGQFIYASVAMKYVSAIHDRPPRRLEVIMGLRPSARHETPFAEIDALYMHILGCCPDIDAVKAILGLVVIGISTVKAIEALLHLECGDVEITLAPLASIIDFRYDRIYLSHASFGDFLIDFSRSETFHIPILTIKENVLLNCLSLLINPPSITTDTLSELADSLNISLENLPLNDTVCEVLTKFSLPTFWKACAKIDIQREVDMDTARAYVVFNLLESLQHASGQHAEGAIFSGVTTTDPEQLLQIYTSHVSSFEPIFKDEIQQFYKNTGVLAFIVLSQMDSFILGEGVPPWPVMKQLLRITEESLICENDNNYLFLPHWTDSTIFHHFKHLFMGPSKSPDICLDGSKYAQTALRILEFLCAHRPRSVLFHWCKPTVTRKRISTKRLSKSNRAYRYVQPILTPHSSVPLYTARRKRRTNISCPRQRREEKHCRGVGLSLPNTKVVPCQVGLQNLPQILERSSVFPALVDFIRAEGKNIAFLPNLTRGAVRSMHEYLSRADK